MNTFIAHMPCPHQDRTFAFWIAQRDPNQVVPHDIMKMLDDALRSLQTEEPPCSILCTEQLKKTRCGKCRMIGCSECVEPRCCKPELNLCVECSPNHICVRCFSDICNDCLAKDRNGNTYCNRCKRVCEFCQEVFDHYDPNDSYCVSCNNKMHSRWNSHQSICRSCCVECHTCTNKVCERCARTCSDCGSQYCDKGCLKECRRCEKEYCRYCSTECSDCGYTCCDACMEHTDFNAWFHCRLSDYCGKCAEAHKESCGPCSQIAKRQKI
jgi:hypothetical protein